MVNLFNTISLENDEKYLQLIENIDKKTALLIVDTALQVAQSNGVFSIQESHAIYESLEILKK